jgi:hypothetical protein
MKVSPETTTARERDEETRERVEERVRFLTHFTYYLGVNVLAVVLDYLTSAAPSWSLYIAAVWGVFLYLHFISAFVVADLRGSFRRWLHRREQDRPRGPGSSGGKEEP